MGTPVVGRRRRGRLGSAQLGALLSLAYLVLVGGGGIAVQYALGEEHHSQEISDILTNGPAPTPTSADPFFVQSNVPPAPAPPSESVPDLSSGSGSADYQSVSGPLGLTTVVPAGWTLDPTIGSDLFSQVDNPADASQFVRYGANPAPAGNLLSVVRSAAHTNPKISAGYRELRLVPVSFHGGPAVDWEFDFEKDGVLRHVYARYWESQGSEYFVYVSGPHGDWTELQPVFAAMAGAALP